MISSCSSPSGTKPSESIKFTTSRSAPSTNARSLPTCAMPNSARCHMSWLSDSAIETLNLLRTRALIARSTCRLPLSECFSGRNRVSRMTPMTMMIRPFPQRAGPRARSGPRSRSLGLKLLFDGGLTAHGLGLGRGELAQNRFHLESFDDVVGFHVVEIFERDTPFVALRDFAHVVLEALEGGELAFPYRAAVADQPRARAAHNLAVDDHASRDGGAGHAENLADFGAAERFFAVGRREQTFHRLAHIVDRFVDDGVEANLDALFLREVRGLRFGTDVEADDDGFGSRRERNVGLRNRARRAVDYFELYFVGGKPRERVGERLVRALHVALENDFEFLDLARRQTLAQIFERDAAGLGEFAFALLGAAILGDLARLRFLDHRSEHSAGLGNAGETENLDRSGRTCLGKTLAEMILHRAHAAVRNAADERIALMQRAFLDEHGGDRAAAAVKLRLDDRATRGTSRIGLQLHHVGLQQDHLEQLVDSLTGAGRDRHDDGVTAVVFGHQANLGQALLDVVD